MGKSLPLSGSHLLCEKGRCAGHQPVTCPWGPCDLCLPPLLSQTLAERGVAGARLEAGGWLDAGLQAPRTWKLELPAFPLLRSGGAGKRGWGPSRGHVPLPSDSRSSESSRLALRLAAGSLQGAAESLALRRLGVSRAPVSVAQKPAGVFSGLRADADFAGPGEGPGIGLLLTRCPGEIMPQKCC